MRRIRRYRQAGSGQDFDTAIAEMVGYFLGSAASGAVDSLSRVRQSWVCSWRKMGTGMRNPTERGNRMTTTAKRVSWGTRERADGSRETICMQCGHSWPIKKIYRYWPIRLIWSPYVFTGDWFSRHGWELGSNSRGQHIYGWTLHLGRLKVCFGPKFPSRNAPTAKICPHCGGIWWHPDDVR